MNKQISFLFIPLLFLFQVLAAPVDFSFSDAGDRLVHRTQEGILPVLDPGAAPDPVKLAKKRSLRIMFAAEQAFVPPFQSTSSSRPQITVHLLTSFSAVSPDARAPPVT